jgi:hypothetical protein
MQFHWDQSVSTILFMSMFNADERRIFNKKIVKILSTCAPSMSLEQFEIAVVISRNSGRCLFFENPQDALAVLKSFESSPIFWETMRNMCHANRWLPHCDDAFILDALKVSIRASFNPLERGKYKQTVRTLIRDYKTKTRLTRLR